MRASSLRLPPMSLDEYQRLGAEGIVSKRADRKYAAGRTKDWLKTKSLQTADFATRLGFLTKFEAVPFTILEGRHSHRYASFGFTQFNKMSSKRFNVCLNFLNTIHFKI